MDRLLLGFLRKVYFASGNILASARRFFYPVKVGLAGGRLVMPISVFFEQDVRFQGAGQLILAEKVMLGYRLSGSAQWPILFQPREKDAVIRIGARTAISNSCEFIARTSITLGSDCRIGPRCVFMDADFHGLLPNERSKPGRTAPILIGDNVWLGSEVMVLKGVTIGNDAVIGARCVVSKDVPAGGIAVGNPMKVIGSVYA